MTSKSWTLIVTAAGLLAVGIHVTWADARQGGTVQGTVKVARPPAALPAHTVTVQPEVCGRSSPNDAGVVGPGGLLPNAVVSLQNVPGGGAQSAGTAAVHLDQRQCRFEPHVQTATVGGQISLTSRDPVLHNIHAYLGTRTLFNVAIPVAGMVVRRPLGEPGRIQIKCDVHSWMSSWVVVFDHPYHAVTGRDGTFRIAGVPQGTYPLEVWHERLGSRSGSATVGAGTVTVDVSY